MNRFNRLADVLSDPNSGSKGAIAFLTVVVGGIFLLFGVMYGVGYAIQYTYYAIGEHVWPFYTAFALILLGMFLWITKEEDDDRG